MVLAIAGFWFGVNQIRLRIKWTRVGEKVIGMRADRIKSTLPNLTNHPWAGEYCAGDGLGDNRRLLLTTTEFMLTESGCVRFNKHVGSVSQENGILSLDYTFAAEPSATRELFPVRWGARHYLIGTNEIEAFCDAVNRGHEPRKRTGGSFYLRRGDEQLRENGFPDVPAQYRKLLLKHRVDGEVVSIGGVTNRPSVNGIGFTDTKVVIDAGTNDGIRAGMVFYVVRPFRSDDSVEITDVSPARCEGVVIQNGTPDVAPAIGWQISTKPFLF